MYGKRARIGRINPSPETVGDEEWRRLMPPGVIVVSTRMYIERVDRDGLTTMVKDVERASRELATARPNVAEPSLPGSGFVFENRIVDASVPEECIPGVEKVIQSALTCGVLAGLPVVDLKVGLTGGK
jgi:maleate cis-trans isomerase